MGVQPHALQPMAPASVALSSLASHCRSLLQRLPSHSFQLHFPVTSDTSQQVSLHSTSLSTSSICKTSMCPAYQAWLTFASVSGSHGQIAMSWIQFPCDLHANVMHRCAYAHTCMVPCCRHPLFIHLTVAEWPGGICAVGSSVDWTTGEPTSHICPGHSAPIHCNCQGGMHRDGSIPSMPCSQSVVLMQAELKMLGINNVGMHNLSPGMVTTDLLMSGTTFSFLPPPPHPTHHQPACSMSLYVVEFSTNSNAQ